MPSLNLDGHQLTYTTGGDRTAPALVMLHGFLSYRGVWRKTLAAFQDSYYCVAPDLLGFGDSDKPVNGEYSLDAHARRLLRLLDTLEIDRFTVIGHSLGGQLAFHLAAVLAPARVMRIVSVAGVVTGRLMPVVEQVSYPQIMLGVLYPWLYGIWGWSARQPGYAQVLFRPWFHRMDAVPFEEWEMDRRMAFQPGMHISAYRTGQAIRNLDLTPVLNRIAVPVLAVYGCQDGVVPVSDARLIEQHIPDNRLVWLDQCGHFPMYEKPQPYLEALREFLA